MKITLSKIKYAAFASEETGCFEAVVLLDGVPSIHVRNDGGGGCDWHDDIVKGSTKRLQEHAASLPEEETQYGKMQPSIETLVGGLLEQHLMLRDMRRRLKNNVLFHNDGKLMACRLNGGMLGGTMEMLIAGVKKRHPNAKILNTMPEDEAIKLWSSQ